MNSSPSPEANPPAPSTQTVVPSSPSSPTLTLAEREQVLEQWNATAMDFPRESCLHHLFEMQATECPEATALIAGDRTLTYGALEDISNRMAHYLRARGAAPGKRIGVCLPRSWEMVTALLGILKTGAAYVPIDPSHPISKVAEIVADARVHTVLTHSGLIERFGAAFSNAHPRCINAAWPVIAAENSEPPQRIARPTDVAYVVYCPAPGEPARGVAVAHRSAVSFAVWARSAFTSADWKGVLAGTSIACDGSVFELFATLAAGGTVLLAEDSRHVPALPAGAAIRMVNGDADVIAGLLEVNALPTTVETVNLTGDPAPTELVDRLYARGHVRRVCQLYGPPECTTFALFAQRERGEAPIIGRPIGNLQAYILDAELQPVAVGVTGELCLGGEGVAVGYLHRAELTAQRFVRPPFRRDDDARIFRTGVSARFRADGVIEWLGNTSG